MSQRIVVASNDLDDEFIERLCCIFAQGAPSFVERLVLNENRITRAGAIQLMRRLGKANRIAMAAPRKRGLNFDNRSRI